MNLLDKIIKNIILFSAKVIWYKKYSSGRRTDKKNPFYLLIRNQFIGRYKFAKELVKDKSVLDIACGDGLGSFILAKNAKQVIGGDYDKEIIKENLFRYKKENLAFEVINAEKIEFKNKFDIVISFETFEHLRNPEKFLSGAYVSLKKGGKLLLSTPNLDFKNKYLDGKYICPTHIHEFSEKELIAMLKDKGFKKIKFYYYHLFSKKVGLISIPLYFLINGFKVLEKPSNKDINPLTFVILAEK